MWGQRRHRFCPPVPPQGVLPPPLLFCPSTPWTPPKTKASLWSWPTGLLPAAFFACFLSADPCSRSLRGQLLPHWPADSSGLRAVPALLPGPWILPQLTSLLPQLTSLLSVDLGQEGRALGAWPLGLQSHQGQMESPFIRALTDLVSSIQPRLHVLTYKNGENNSHPMGLSGRLNVSQTPSSGLPHSGGTV